MRKGMILLVLGGFLLFSCNNQDASTASSKTQRMDDFADVQVNTDSESEKFSYSLGVDLADRLKNMDIDSIDMRLIDQVMDDTDENWAIYAAFSQLLSEVVVNEEIDRNSLNREIMKRGVHDYLSEDSTLLSISEIQTSLNSFVESNRIKISERNLAAGKEFLEVNGTKEGVSITNTGLQHQLIEEGTGQLPKDDDLVTVEVVLKSIEGEELLDTTGSPTYVNLIGPDPNPSIFPYTNPGLIEGLKLYPIGSHFRLFIPANLGFGETRIAKELGPQSTLIYEVKSIEKMEEGNKKIYQKNLRDQIKAFQQMQQQQGR